MEEDTVCYTYKVEMIIHLLSDSEPKAAEQLEKNGGYVSSRKVSLIDSVPLIKGYKTLYKPHSASWDRFQYDRFQILTIPNLAYAYPHTQD